MTSADENFKDAPQPSEKHVTKSSETTLNFYHLIVCGMLINPFRKNSWDPV